MKAGPYHLKLAEEDDGKTCLRKGDGNHCRFRATKAIGPSDEFIRCDSAALL